MEQHEQNKYEGNRDNREPGQSEHEMQPLQTQSLARWLLEVMQSLSSSPSTPPSSVSPSDDTDGQLELTLQGGYHPRFYQQLPDFAFALLNDDTQTTIVATHNAPLLFHLLECRVCYENFLEVYDAMNAALYPHGPRPILGQGTRTLAAMPQRMLEHLCKIWISQAEAVLRLARHDGTNKDEMARLLLQQAIHLSAHITQYTIRQQALQDLVRVATLFDEGQNEPRTQAAHSYTPVFAGGRGVVRRADAPSRSKDAVPENVPIVLQSHTLEGTVTQQDHTLVLHLRDLDTSLRGVPVVVSILLGSLLEPIRWSGGNPLAIHSTMPVDASGALTLPLGETELRLNNPEERNMLEATFLLVEVRRATS